ncbi:hypothetical protein ACN28S_48400 [Cystobacter fuscus]
MSVLQELPANADFISVSNAQGQRRRNRLAVGCELGGLNGNASTTVNVVVRPTGVGSVATSAEVSEMQQDLAEQNNTASLLVNVDPWSSLPGAPPSRAIPWVDTGRARQGMPGSTRRMAIPRRPWRRRMKRKQLNRGKSMAVMALLLLFSGCMAPRQVMDVVPEPAPVPGRVGEGPWLLQYTQSNLWVRTPRGTQVTR